MTRIYHDSDADLAQLDGQSICVVGYGNQGRSQALNLRDSGLAVHIGSIRDASHRQAEVDGFEVLPIAEACARADVILLLIPDEVMPEVYAEHVAPQLGGRLESRPPRSEPQASEGSGLAAGVLLAFASGYNVAFDLIQPPPEVDVVLVAPRMIGVGVRDAYLEGGGFPSFVGVHQDASGHARDRMLAIAKGLGSTRAGCIEMSMHDEASLDLFTEQAFGPAFGRVMMSAVELLVGAGYPPEAVLLELYLSGEFAYSLEKAREVGMTRQMDFHSHTSQYGTLTRGARFLDLDGPIKDRMRGVLEEIRSGKFAQEWTAQREHAGELFEKLRAARDAQPIARWERSAREVFRIGDAAPDRGRAGSA